jgi:hypothetical protein
VFKLTHCRKASHCLPQIVQASPGAAPQNSHQDHHGMLSLQAWRHQSGSYSRVLQQEQLQQDAPSTSVAVLTYQCSVTPACISAIAVPAALGAALLVLLAAWVMLRCPRALGQQALHVSASKRGTTPNPAHSNWQRLEHVNWMASPAETNNHALNAATTSVCDLHAEDSPVSPGHCPIIQAPDELAWALQAPQERGVGSMHDAGMVTPSNSFGNQASSQPLHLVSGLQTSIVTQHSLTLQKHPGRTPSSLGVPHKPSNLGFPARCQPPLSQVSTTSQSHSCGSSSRRTSTAHLAVSLPATKGCTRGAIQDEGSIVLASGMKQQSHMLGRGGQRSTPRTMLQHHCDSHRGNCTSKFNDSCHLAGTASTGNLLHHIHRKRQRGPNTALLSRPLQLTKTSLSPDEGAAASPCIAASTLAPVHCSLNKSSAFHSCTISLPTNDGQ